MFTHWNVGSLDPKSLFEVVDNRDPDTSSRFSLPIPNFLDNDGNPITEHESIRFLEKKGEFRFMFQNYVDGCEQGVKIDGTGVIMFMSPTEKQCSQIKEIMNSFGVEHKDLSSDMIVTALDKIYTKTGITDRWNSDTGDLDRRFDAVHDVEGQYYGRFVYKHGVSSALYIEGNGVFDGVAASDQRFEGGGFILFPKKSIDEASEIIKRYDPLNPEKTGAKVVGQSEFLKTRRINNGADNIGLPIKLYDIPKQIKPKRSYYKPTPIAGFGDNSHEVETIQSAWIQALEKTYALYGFSKIGTRAIEDISVLRLEEGLDERSKVFEVKAASSNSEKARYGLRYDHTVPLARYVAENKSEINFPFKSARIGPVWRNTRDIKRGVSREFVQADIDIVGIDSVPIEYDAEFPRIMHDALTAIDLLDIEIGISNRKITDGFLQAIGLDDDIIKKVRRLIELKCEIGVDGIRAKLYEDLDLDKRTSDQVLDFAQIKSVDTSFKDSVLSLGKSNPLLLEGLEELEFTMKRLEDLPEGVVVADLSVVRGMDYYTGTVYEGRSVNHPEFPPVVVGGRYDNLVGHFMKASIPGVGASLDVTCALAIIQKQKQLSLEKRTPTQVLVTYQKPEDVASSEEIAKNLRQNGIPTEVVYGDKSLKQQMRYALKKRVPYLMFSDNEGNTEIRNMEAKTQEQVDINTWKPKI